MTIWNPGVLPSDAPLYRAIADAIARDVKNGRLKPGDQLPTHRELADRLGVTVGTITRSYAETSRRGLTRGETGRGTYIGSASNSEPTFEHLEDSTDAAVDMGINIPLSFLDPDLSETFRKLSLRTDLQSALRYYPSRGAFHDRELAASWLMEQHRLEASPDNILITSGGQHALTVALSGAFRPGDTIAVERTTYPMIKTLARRFNLRLFPIAMDDEGMIPECLEEACDINKIHGIYCMPSAHNPTTAIMSGDRRLRLGQVADRHHLLILEDDAYALLNEHRLTPISGLFPSLGFHIASFSKPVTPGLRFGYLSVPESYVKRIEHAIADTQWMASPLSARIARDWILDGTAISTISRKQQEARRRNLLCRSILDGQMLHSIDTGYFVWLELPKDWTASDFAREASEKKVIVTPLEHYLVGRDRPDHEAVRIAISGPESLPQLEHGLRVIRNLLDEPEF